MNSAEIFKIPSPDARITLADYSRARVDSGLFPQANRAIWGVLVLRGRNIRRRLPDLHINMN
jgi:hypothetical protein